MAMRLRRRMGMIMVMMVIGNEESVGVIWLPVKEGDRFAQIPTYYHADRQTSFNRNETAVIQSCPFLLPPSKVSANLSTNPPDPRYEDLTITTTVPRNAW